MPGNVVFPEDWNKIVPDLISDGGNPDRARQMLFERDRRLDSYFETLGSDLYVPVVTQNGVAVTLAAGAFTNAVSIRGMRVGPWVMMNMKLVVGTGAGAGGPVRVQMPPTLLTDPTIAVPQRAPNMVGDMTFYDDSTGAYTTGAADIINSGGSPWFTPRPASIAPTLANADEIYLTVQYMIALGSL